MSIHTQNGRAFCLQHFLDFRLQLVDKSNGFLENFNFTKCYIRLEFRQKASQSVECLVQSIATVFFPCTTFSAKTMLTYIIVGWFIHSQFIRNNENIHNIFFLHIEVRRVQIYSNLIVFSVCVPERHMSPHFGCSSAQTKPFGAINKCTGMNKS